MTDGGRVLIVDDEPAIRLFLSAELSQAGYHVLVAPSGEQALELLDREPVDLVLLDLKMRAMSGLQVMAEIARRPLPPAVVLLTAYTSLDSAIEAMRYGGHDYLIKPCGRDELLASIETGLRRRREAVHRDEMIRLIETTARRLAEPDAGAAPSPPTVPRFLEARGLRLDRARQQVTRGGEELSLTSTEFRLLLCLMERADQVVSHDALMEALHGSAADRWESRPALNTHLWRLRKKVGDDPGGTPYIVNVRGRGYTLEA